MSEKVDERLRKGATLENHSRNICRGFFLPLTNDDPEFEPAKAAWARAKHKEVAAVNRRKLADDYRKFQAERRVQENKRYLRERQIAEEAEKRRKDEEERKKQKAEEERKKLAEYYRQTARGEAVSDDDDDGDADSDDEKGDDWFM